MSFDIRTSVISWKSIDGLSIRTCPSWMTDSPFRNLTISHFNATAVLGSTFGIRAMLYFCPNARNTTDSKHTRRPGLSITSSNTETARTVAFDHAKRLAWRVGGSGDEDPQVEYFETESGTVDYILHNEDGVVALFVLSYHPHAGNADEIAVEFDPTVGKHPRPGGEELLDIDYEAPYRFIIADSLPKEVTQSGSLVVERDGVNLCYIPYWLFLLVC